MSHRSIIRGCAAGWVALSAGCAHTRVTRFDPMARPPQRTPASEIRFYGTTRPNCPYEEIGRISAESRLFVSWSRVVQAARNAAHDLGGDAVIGVQDGTRLSSATVTQAGVTIGETSSISGIVIRFRHLDCMQ
jgi:hypothetical protein